MKTDELGEILRALPDSRSVAEAAEVLTQLASVFVPNVLAAGRVPSDLIQQWDHAQGTDEGWPAVAAHYRILVEQIPAVVFMAFLDKGIGEAFVSPQVEAMLGFTQEEWLNNPVRLYEQIHPDDKMRWSVEAAQMLMTGEPLRSVYRVMTRDSRVVWFHCEVKMVRHADGRPWFIHGVGFDITELKVTEQALAKSEEMLSGIFEFAPDTMVVADAHGRIERVNAQVEPMFGYRPDELLGQPVEVLLPERFRPKHAEHRDGYLADPHLRPMGAGLVLYGRRKDGSEFPVEIMLSPVAAAAGTLVISVIRDITRRQRNEEAVREYADRMKVLSHRLIEVQEAERRGIALELHDEIGQILTGLKLKLEISERLDVEQARARIAEAQTLVNELMARTRKLSLDLRPATLDHLGLLPALFMHIRRYRSQTEVRVDFKHTGVDGRRFGPDLETAAFRIIQEALTNVARHAEVGAVEVRVWADDATLALQVEDHGRGFVPESVLVPGSSSGLPGMRERAVLLGGQFNVESSPESGTCVTARWPIGGADQQPRAIGEGRKP